MGFLTKLKRFGHITSMLASLKARGSLFRWFAYPTPPPNPDLRSEKEKMLAGDLYNCMDPELVQLREECRATLEELNHKSSITRLNERQAILRRLFGADYNVYVEPPFYCDYGKNTKIGKGCYFNFNVTILDVAEVKIGDNVLIAPNAAIYTATHPVDVVERTSGKEYALPITIGNNCWLGGSCVICPGVTLGDNVVVAAGAVVTKDVPSDCVVAGGPARIIKRLKPKKYVLGQGFVN